MKKIILFFLVIIIIADLLWGNTWHLIFQHDSYSLWQILYYFRLPRIVNSLIAGIGLGLAGLVLQTVFHNPLAGPYVLGISSGSALGVAIALMILGSMSKLISFVGTFMFALVGALLVIIILTILARHYSMVAIIIAGVLLAGIFSALISVLQYFSPAYSVKNYVVWTMASVDMSNYPIIITNLIIIILSTIAIASKTTILDSFYLGEEYALTMGVNVREERTKLIIIIGIIIAFLTASYGPIAFVGVISPHIARWLTHSMRHNVLILYSGLVGAGIMVMSDFLSHAFGVTIPLNAILSLLGLPVMFLLVLKREYEFF